MRITKTSIAGAALLAALAAGAAVPGAFAQTASEHPIETQTEDPFEDRHAEVQTELAAQRNAEHLAELTERLDAAVEEGSLTRAQADAILEAREAGVIGDFGGRGHRGGFGHGRPRGHGPGLPLADSHNSGPEAPEGDTDA